MPELWKFSTNEMNFGAHTKETLKKSSAFKSFHSDKKTLVLKKLEAWPIWKSIIAGQK